MSKQSIDNAPSFQSTWQKLLSWKLSDQTIHRQGVVKRLGQINSQRIRSQFERMQASLQRRLISHPTSTRFPVFIIGSNRSGTQMVCEAIGRSPHGWDYQESEANIAFKDYQLRADWLIRLLIRLSPAPIVSFGNILDSQFADDLLRRYDGAKAIWVYRRYQDAANSCVQNWGSHLKDDMVRWVARGELDKLGPRGKRISNDTVQLFAKLYRDDLSNEEGACLYWYMRNRLYFDLNLHEDPRVLIVQYEDTVLNKERAFRRIFNFLNFPYTPTIVDRIFASSVNKQPWTNMDPEIQAVCDTLKAQLDMHYAKTSEWSG